MNRLTMVSQPGNNSRGASDPMDATFSDVKREMQALMMGAVVVYAANQIHARSVQELIHEAKNEPFSRPDVYFGTTQKQGT